MVCSRAAGMGVVGEWAGQRVGFRTVGLVVVMEAGRRRYRCGGLCGGVALSCRQPQTHKRVSVNSAGVCVRDTWVRVKGGKG